MKKWQHIKWSEKETNAVIGTIIVILCLIGMFYWGKSFYGSNNSVTELKQQFIISGSGVDIEAALDNNPDTVWTSSDTKSYNSMNYLVIDYKNRVEISKIDMLLGTSGVPINYLITIQTSDNGNIWNDVIGGIETGYFDKKTNFEFPILKQNSRYLRIGIKPYGTSFLKFKVYEIKIN